MSSITRLTNREVEVLTLLVQGLRNGKIAEQLVVTENTIEFHLKNIYRKLQVMNRSQAVRIFLEERVNDYGNP